MLFRSGEDNDNENDGHDGDAGSEGDADDADDADNNTDDSSGSDAIEAIEHQCSAADIAASGIAGDAPRDLSTCEFLNAIYTTGSCLSPDVDGDGDSDSDDCLAHLPHLNETMRAYGLNCNAHRRATFLAQTLLETKHFETFYQPIDDGAGMIHITPTNFRALCEEPDWSDLKDAFASEFGCSNANA